MAKIIGAQTTDDALEALRAQIARSERAGERTLVFCEDRLTLLAERAAVAEVGGTFFTEVTTFARYLSGPRVLSKQGSVLEISALIAEHGKELLCFRPRAAQAVYETIAQLSASRVDGDMLRASAEKTEGVLKGKLLDLALLYDAYTARLRERGLVDESGYLALLPDKLASDGLGAVNLIFFGFRSFTRQALEGVRAALRNAKSVTGIFLAGKAPLYTNEGARLFRAVCEEEDEAEVSMQRCSLEGEALRLRDGLFSPEHFGRTPLRTEKIRRFAAADEPEEFSVVAALIKKHISEGMRFKEIAVLVAGKESFLPLEKAFSAYKIPFFADKKRAFSEHPFCTFVFDVLSATANGVLPEDADAIASSLYFGNGDNYRNYLLKYGGYRGAVRREIKEGNAVKQYDRDELAACRERMLSILQLFPRKGRGADHVAAVRALYAFSDAEKRTEELAASFTGAEREFLSLKPLEGVLAEIEAIAGGAQFTAREFLDGLKSALSALEISMIPQSLDAVFVGEATESRFERVKVLFATGLTDALPRVSPDTAVITDGEMQKLSEIKVEIEPAIAEVNARAREGLALNLCAFSEALYLSRPLKKRGDDTERSEILGDAEMLFEMPPMPDLFPFDCSEREPAMLCLLRLKEDIERKGEWEEKKYSALYEGLGRPDALLGGSKKQAVPEAESLYETQSSPSRLEGYFACPYAGFVKRGLRLSEREERAVLETDAGTFIHAVLEETAKRFNELSSEEECRAYARTVGEELIRSRFAALADTGAGRYTGERLVAEGATVAVACFRQLTGSRFRVWETEKKISVPELSLSGKTDRVDISDDYVRVIDYKTGSFDNSLGAYYMGRSLQLELYLRGASEGKRPAGAFYFPATDDFMPEGEPRFRMSGFYCNDEEVLTRLDASLKEGETSALFEGKFGGRPTERGMNADDFRDFLDYAVLVSQKAQNEMRAGNITPSPTEKACTYCKLRSLCGYDGPPRKETGVTSAELIGIVRREKGEI